MKKLLSFLAIMLIAIIPIFANAQTVPSVQYQWEPSVGGSPVVEYVVEVKVDGGDWAVYATVTSSEITFVDIFEYMKTYEVHVAGVDASGRQGAFSLPSDPFTPDLGVPGQPGQPIRVP